MQLMDALMPEAEIPLRRRVRLDFWTRWLGPDSPYPEAREERLRPGRPLPDWARTAFPEDRTTIRILDVNAGPLSGLGDQADGRRMELVPVDELAFHFDRALAEEDLEPPVRTRHCAPEDVRVAFGEQAFDLVYSYNGLDFLADPVAVYQELLAVLKPGGRIVTFHEAIEDAARIHRDGYRFFHGLHNGRVILRNKSRRWDLQDALPGAAVQGSRENGAIRVEIRRARQRSVVPPRPRREESDGPPPLISLHIPKSGGSSFREFLGRLYGDSLRTMYAFEETAPRMAHTIELEPGTRCLHGHFQADAFDHLLPGALHITWLRHPVERVISGYYQFLRNPHTADESDFNRSFFEEGLNLMEFARHENIRSSLFWYLNAVPVEAFDFIGITEEYDRSMRVFCQLLGVPEPEASGTVNTNPDKPVASRYPLAPPQRLELEALYAAEIDLYDRARLRLEAEYQALFGPS
jgi:hypothetical protein